MEAVMRVSVFVLRAAAALALSLSALSFAGEGERTQIDPSLPAQLRGATVPDFFTLGLDNETEFNRDDVLEAVKKSGAKRVVLSFFATWCEVCMREFVTLKNNADNLKKNGVQIYLIDVGESIHAKGALAEKFVKQYAGGAFPYYFDPNANTLQRFGLIENAHTKYPLPIIVVLDSKLKVLRVLREPGDDFPQILWGDL
jgi:alkyl hydroperoxide reductase subunit AhpC